MNNIVLTNNDRQILNSYKYVLDGFAAYLSNSYEFVLHSFEDLNKSVIYIINGKHTGRTVGAPITDLALNMFGEMSKEHVDYMVYFSKNKIGEPLKSTTIAIRGENNRIIGLICINMYLNTPFSEIISSFVPGTMGSNIVDNISEDFPQNPDDLIKSKLDEEMTIVMADDTILPSNKNKVIIEHLYDKGIFQLKDSVLTVEKLMGISKNTIYMHIRNYKKKSYGNN